MARNSRLWQDSLAHIRQFTGDEAECNKWYAWAKQKLGFMLRSTPGATSQVFMPVEGVMVRVDTRPNRISIAAGGGVWPTYKPTGSLRNIYKKPGLTTGDFTQVADTSTYPLGFRPTYLGPYDGSWSNDKNKAIRWRNDSTSVSIGTSRVGSVVTVDLSGESPYLKLFTACIAGNTLLLVFYNYDTATAHFKSYASFSGSTAYATLTAIGSPLSCSIDPNNSRGTGFDMLSRSLLVLRGALGISDVTAVTFSPDLTTYTATDVIALGGNAYNYSRFMVSDGDSFTVAYTESATPGNVVSVSVTPTYTTTTVSWAVSAPRLVYAVDYFQSYIYNVYKLLYSSAKDDIHLYAEYVGTGAGDTVFDSALVLDYKGAKTSLITGPASIIGFINSSDSYSSYLGDFVKVKTPSTLFLSGRYPDYSGLYYYATLSISVATGLVAMDDTIATHNKVIQGLAITI